MLSFKLLESFSPLNERLLLFIKKSPELLYFGDKLQFLYLTCCTVVLKFAIGEIFIQLPPSSAIISITNVKI